MTLLTKLENLRRELCVTEDDYIAIQLKEDFACVDAYINDREYSVGICVDDTDDDIVSALRECFVNAQ